MSRDIKCSPDELVALIEKGAREIEGKVHDILEVVSKKAVTPVRRKVPVAFGELRDSIHAVPGAEPKTVVDAPHAASVEVGSLPHLPNIEKLTEWVKLRGLQGLQGKRQIRKMAGVTTAAQAAKVAKQLRGLEVKGNSRRMFLKDGSVNSAKAGRHSPINAPEQVAWAIASVIQKEGTKPHWFVKNALPEIEKILHQQIKAHLKK